MLIIRLLHAGDADSALLKLQLTFDRAAIARLLAGLRPEQLSALCRHFTFDFVHPLWYGGFLLLLTARLFNLNGIGSRWNALLFGPPLMALLDTIENIMHYPLLTGKWEVAALPVAIAAICASVRPLAHAAVGVPLQRVPSTSCVCSHPIRRPRLIATFTADEACGRFLGCPSKR